MATLLGTFTAAKNLLPLFSTFSMDQQLAKVDVVLFGADAWQLAKPIVDCLVGQRWMEFLYIPVWFFATTTVPAIVALQARPYIPRTQFIVSWALCWILLGNVVAAAFMSAGPAFYNKVTGDQERFQLLLEMLRISKGLPYAARDIQNQLWQAYTHNLVQLTSGISAFPSLHVSMATLLLLLATRVGTISTLAAAVFLGLILIGSVYLGWHYAVDGCFSIVATVTIWSAVGYALNRRPANNRWALPQPVAD